MFYKGSFSVRDTYREFCSCVEFTVKMSAYIEEINAFGITLNYLAEIFGFDLKLKSEQLTLKLDIYLSHSKVDYWKYIMQHVSRKITSYTVKPVLQATS